MTPKNSRIMEMYDSGTVSEGTLSKSKVLLVQWIEERSGRSGWLLPPRRGKACFFLWLTISPSSGEEELMKGTSRLRSMGLPGANTEHTHSSRQPRCRQLEMMPVFTRPYDFLSLVNITVPIRPVTADTPISRLRSEPLMPCV